MPPHSPIELTVIAGFMTLSGVLVTCVGSNLYRLDEEAELFVAAENDDEVDSYPRFGDIMVAETVDEQSIRYIALHERGPYKHFCFIITRDVEESEATAAFLALVSTEGGHWERGFMGGILYIAIPEGSSLEPSSSLFGTTGEA